MPRILIVDDDSMVRKVLARMFEPAGFEVLACDSGRAALHLAQAQRPDVVLLDINLPDIGGHEVCRLLKADRRTSHIPVLMLTGEALEVASRIAGLDCGAEDYMFKPLSSKVLIPRVKHILSVTRKPTP